MSDSLHRHGFKYFKIAFEITFSAVTGFLLGAIILWWLGYDPWRIYGIVFAGGISDPDYLLSKATPLMLTGLAFSVPMLAGVFNIGGEGQLYVGAITSLVTSYFTGNAVLGLAVGTFAGALLGGGIAALKVYRDVNEVVSAIMLNWILYFTILYVIVAHLYNPLMPQQSVPVPVTAQVGSIPTPWGSVHSIFFIGAAAAILIYYILYHTKLGYVMRVAGMSPKSARYAGFSPEKSTIYSMMIGGGAAGLGGALLIQGYVHSIDVTMSTLYGLGFLGIGVGLLGWNNPIGIIFSSVFFSALIIGGEMVELTVGTPPELADVIIGIIVIALALPYAYNMLLNKVFRRVSK